MNICNKLSTLNNYISIKSKSYFMTSISYFEDGPLLNYCIEDNAGDSFNRDFIKDFFKEKTRLYYGGKRNHTLFCGSILAKSNKNSVILGAGFISEEQSLNAINYNRIIGVRGNLTAQSLLIHDKNISFQFKADPGLLAREIVKPRDENYISNGLVGVIPHFVDSEIANKIIGSNPNYLIIDIKKEYKEVCSQILKCDKVLSSSLHGLIFSDAMNVPNTWIGFSNKLKGGDFKFRDYYSVMTSPKLKMFHCESISDLIIAANDSKVSINLDYYSMYKAVNNHFSK